MRDRVRPAVGLLACLVLAAACGFDTGPSLDVSVEQPTLQPTAANASLCCCRVVGNVTNRSSVPVHVDVAFDSFEAGAAEASGRALDFVESLQPSETRRFTAVGFVQPCSAISRLELVRPLNVRAVWLPE